MPQIILIVTGLTAEYSHLFVDVSCVQSDVIGCFFMRHLFIPRCFNRLNSHILLSDAGLYSGCFNWHVNELSRRLLHLNNLISFNG